MNQRITKTTQKLMQQFANRKPIRAGSLIVTIFGDTVAPRGGSLWLGSLIAFFEHLQISQRLVRTASYRLVQADILQNEAIGRRSFYSLTRNGKRRFDEATERIYSERHPEWDGSWCLILISKVDSTQRPQLRKDLAWLGFGAFGNDVLAHPSPDRVKLMSHLDALGCRDEIVMLDGRLPIEMSDQSLMSMVRTAWDLEALETSYAGFLQQFHPLLSAIRKGGTPNPEEALYIRTLLIHEYRKVLLRDPALPDELLPPTWKGHSAYRLTQELYRQVTAPAESYVTETFECEVGALPDANAAFHQRFGGLHLDR